MADLRHLAPARAGSLFGPSRATIEAAIREIESTKDGAFVPLSRHPVFGAVLYPFGGLGIIALLEFLSLSY